MKKSSLFTIAASAGLAATSASAQWTLINDFESGEVPTYAVNTTSSEAELIIIDDAGGVTGNKGFFIWSGEIGVSYADTRVSVPLPQAVGPGQTATVYWRFYQYGADNNFHMATSDLDTLNAWDNLNAIFRVSARVPEVGMYGSSGYEVSSPAYSISIETWYENWMVIDFDSNSYELYVKGPSDASPVRLTGSVTSSGNFGFRRLPTDPIDFLVVASNSDNASTPNQGDDWVVDDIYFAMGDLAGQDPLNPQPTYSWGGITGTSTGWVSTGTWLGWIWVGTKPWVFSQALNSYIYAPDPGAGAAGTWVYTVNRN